VLLGRKLSVLIAAAMVVIASILASCGGSETEQAEGKQSGGDASNKQEGGRLASSGQKNLQVFGKLPKGESARPGESLQTRIVPEPQGRGVGAQIFLPEQIGPQPSTSLPAELTYEEFVRWVADDLNAFWLGLYIRAQQQSSSLILYLPPVVKVAHEPVPINEPNCEQHLGPTFDPEEGPVYCRHNTTIYIPTGARVPSTQLLIHEHGDFALALRHSARVEPSPPKPRLLGEHAP
jgi:hypothetical protein